MTIGATTGRRGSTWRGYELAGLNRVNQDLQEWLTLKSKRVHGRTCEQIAAQVDQRNLNLEQTVNKLS